MLRFTRGAGPAIWPGKGRGIKTLRSARRPSFTPSARSSVSSLRTETLPNGMECAYVSRQDLLFLFREVYESKAYLRNGVVLKEGDTVLVGLPHYAHHSPFPLCTSACEIIANDMDISRESSPISLYVMQCRFLTHFAHPMAGYRREPGLFCNQGCRGPPSTQHPMLPSIAAAIIPDQLRQQANFGGH